MKISPLIAVLTLLLTSAATHAEITTRPIGLTIGSPAIADMDFSFKPNSVNAGTSVHLLVTGFEHSIVKLDDDNSSLDIVTDSTGKDLLKKHPPKENGFTFTQKPFGHFPKISEDGKQLIVELITPQTPSIGTTSITYQGKLAVTVAEGRKTISAKDIATEPGQVQLGEHSIEITAFGPSDWQEGKSKLSLKMTKTLLDAIASWKITAPDGTVLCDHPNSTMTMMNTAQLELTLDQAAETINIELELYDGMQLIEVPVNAKVSLGIE